MHAHRLRCFFGCVSGFVSVHGPAMSLSMRRLSRSCVLASRAPLAQQPLGLLRASPVVSGRSSRIDLVARPVRADRSGRRRPDSRARPARRPSTSSRSRASARAGRLRRSLRASSSVARRRPNTIGVGVAELGLAQERGADAQRHRRLALRDLDVHAAVVRERDERAPHARLDPQRNPPASGSAVRRRSSVSRPRPLVDGPRQLGERAWASDTTDVVLGSTRSPPTARATASAARGRRSAAAPRPGRAWPSPRACRPASRRRARRPPSRSRRRSRRAPAPASAARPSSAPQAWASSTMPRWPRPSSLSAGKISHAATYTSTPSPSRTRRARTTAARCRPGHPSARRALHRRRRASGRRGGG